MILHCPVCNQNADLKIKKDTEDVICMDCGSIVEINPFVKRSMIQQKDFWVEAKKAFTFECVKCHKGVQPIYDKKKDKCVCPTCQTDINISRHMALVIKNGLSGQDITPNDTVRKLK